MKPEGEFSMGPTIGDILPLAVGVAISPVPIIAVILMLFTPQARTNAPAFALGWALALLVIGGIALAASDAGDVATEDTPSDLSYAVKLLFGVLLLLMAGRQWQSRPKEGEEPQMPKWMARIDTFTAGRSLGLGALLAGANPKNLGLTLAAAISIGQAGLDGAEPWLALLVFVAIASVSVAGPVLYYLVAGASAERALTSGKTWLIANNATVMAIVLLVFGAVLAGQGFGGLTA
jgi:hypothetical protein